MKRNPLLLAIIALVVLGLCPYATAAKGGVPNGQPFQALQTQIDDLEATMEEQLELLWVRIDELQAAIDANTFHDVEQDELIAILGGALAMLESRVSDNEDEIAALQAKDQLLEGLIAALEGKVADLDEELNTQGESIEALVLRDQALQHLIDVLTERVLILEGMMVTANANIASLSLEISALKSRISSAESAIASKQERITDYCGEGSSIRKVNSNGTVVCESDTVATGGFTTFTTEKYYIEEDPTDSDSNGWFEIRTYCPSMSKRTGGGFYLNVSSMYIYGSHPSYTNSWRVIVKENSSSSAYFVTYVVCATIL